MKFLICLVLIITITFWTTSTKPVGSEIFGMISQTLSATFIIIIQSYAIITLVL